MVKRKRVGFKVGPIKQVDIGKEDIFAHRPRRVKTMFSKETPVQQLSEILSPLAQQKKPDVQVSSVAQVQQPKPKNMIVEDDRRKQEEMKPSLLSGNIPRDEAEEKFWASKGGKESEQKIVNVMNSFENTNTSTPIDYTPDFGYVYAMWQKIGSIISWPISKHGNFCGPYYGVLSEADLQKQPIDEIDALCQSHDFHYCLNKVPFFSYNADRLLVNGATTLLKENPMRPHKAYLIGMISFFTLKMKAEIALYGQPIIMDLPSVNDYLFKQGVYAEGRPPNAPLNAEEMKKKQEQEERMKQIQTPGRVPTKEEIIGKEPEKQSSFLENVGSVIKDVIQNPATMIV